MEKPDYFPLLEERILILIEQYEEKADHFRDRMQRNQDDIGDAESRIAVRIYEETVQQLKETLAPFQIGSGIERTDAFRGDDLYEKE